eukprot:GHVR01059572.1.p1 GENE.GHVR01059572.1~~GHVR01059572.1.p1  ORF type:complete len:184 (+),score=17.76 GHVR01059572.1:454-1005(+)
MSPDIFKYSTYSPPQTFHPFATLLMVARNNLQYIARTYEHLKNINTHSGCSLSELKKMFGETFVNSEFTQRSTVHWVVLENEHDRFFYKVPRAKKARAVLSLCSTVYKAQKEARERMQSLYQARKEERMQRVLSRLAEEDRDMRMSFGEESKLEVGVSRMEDDLMRGAFAHKRFCVLCFFMNL